MKGITTNSLQMSALGLGMNSTDFSISLSN
jgi:hypothetical protein